MNVSSFKKLLGVLGVAVLFGTAAFAQEAATGKLKIHVDPEEAYTFVDGQAYGPGNHEINLTAGDHKILIANYGFAFHEETVPVEPNGTARMDVKLEAKGGLVSGPHGRLQIEVGDIHGSTHAAVLLNGQTPAYFVGHVDEFNNNAHMAKQELIVPPGTFLVTVTKHGKVTWSGNVTIAENQRVILNIANGEQTVKEWEHGATVGDLPRFKAGIASAKIAIAPVNGNITATPSRIDCNQPSQLAWNSTETIDADISGFSPVPVSGEKTVSPRQTTTYQFTATGPGGVTKSSATLEVNPVVTSAFATSPTDVRYRKIGDKVIVQDSTTLNWTTGNTDAASIAPLGSVALSGTKSVKPVPAQTAYGPVNEDVKYTLNASNVCGGSDLKTVAVHVTGSIEPIPEVALHSVFFPTDFPMKDQPSVGLLASQRQTLKTLAAGFTKYLEYDPDAKLNVVAHADVRGADIFNMELAQRRVEIVKAFLVSQGIAAEKINVSALGEQDPIDKAAVAQLESQNPETAPAARAADKNGMQVAYQRRVDIVMLPTNAQSKRFYPHAAPDSQLLWQQATLSRSAVEKAQ